MAVQTGPAAQEGAIDVFLKDIAPILTGIAELQFPDPFAKKPFQVTTNALQAALLECPAYVFAPYHAVLCRTIP